MESTDLDTNVDCVEEVVEHEVSEGLKLVIFKICNFILKTFFFYGKKTSVSNSTIATINVFCSATLKKIT